MDLVHPQGGGFLFFFLSGVIEFLLPRLSSRTEEPKKRTPRTEPPLRVGLRDGRGRPLRFLAPVGAQRHLPDDGAGALESLQGARGKRRKRAKRNVSTLNYE